MRVASLVPSATESLLALGVRPVACTRFCEQPGIPTVGGTKNPDVDALIALKPDLVVVNDEENRREDAEALSSAGLALIEISPRDLDDLGRAVCDLASAVGVSVPPPFDSAGWAEWLGGLPSRVAELRSAFVPVWRRPWMTLAPDTYGASVLQACGLEPVGGSGEARYPETTLEEVADLQPDLVVLPDEPYPFTEVHAAEIGDALGDVDRVFVDGRDLFWWGTRTPDAVRRLRSVFSGE